MSANLTQRLSMQAIIARLRAGNEERDAELERLRKIEEAKPMMERWTAAYDRLLRYQRELRHFHTLSAHDILFGAQMDLEELTERLTPDEQTEAALYKLSHSGGPSQ